MSKARSSWASPSLLLLITTVILSLVGLFFVFEASVAEAFSMIGNQYHFLQQQSKWWILGIVGMVICSRLNTKLWHYLGPILYIVSIVLLTLLIIPGVAPEINGAKRWLVLGGLTLQPVEVLKFSMIAFYANWMQKHQRLAPFIALTIFPVFLVLLQPDLGSALVAIAIAFGMYFAAGANLKIFSAISIIGIIGLMLIIVISPYRMKRLTTYLNPEQDPLGSSFHIRQITLALGNGGLLGQGIGQSRQKYSYIPEASSDSIMAIIAEEIGFVGAMSVLAGFGLYSYLGYQIITNQKPDSFEYLFATGIVIWITAQALLNVAAVAALVPLTGLPLPFISYGGSSLVMVLCATGMLAAVGRKT